MNRKVLHTLEYYKILDRLTEYAASDEVKERCKKLTPLTDPDEIARLQQTTADALSRLYRNSDISFLGIHNMNTALRRLEIGGTLNTAELLQISSLLEVARRAKAYERSHAANGHPAREADAPDGDAPELTDSISPLFAQLAPLTPLHEEIKRCILGEDEIADDASPGLFKLRRQIHGMNDKIHSQLTSLMNNQTMRGYLQDTVVTMRDGRYCLPVRSDAKGNVPGMVPD